MSLILNGTVGVTFPDTTTQSTAAGAVDVQTFDESGTWTKPVAGSMARIQVWGGGGGGGRNTGNSNASGGGGGGYNEITVPLSSLGATETVTVGAGGAGRTGSTGNGTAGGNSFFGAICAAYGGAGGRGGLGWIGGGGQTSAGAVITTSTALLNSIYGGPSYAQPLFEVSSSQNQSRYWTNPSPFHGGLCAVVGVACASDFITLTGSMYGGGAGAHTNTTNNVTGGESLYGGNGGDGGRVTSNFNGATPAGGGGARNNNLNGGNGGSGRVIVTVW
jgi:hypothetical protein